MLSALALQTRVDRKYLLTPAQFTAFLAETAGSFHALEIDECRLFGYESVYFDTPNLDLYREHRQGRRCRFKARTRTYLDSGECLFEVKLQARRTETIKRRIPYRLEDRDRIAPDAQRFLNQALSDEYGTTAPFLTATYTRSTLVDLGACTRLTCDVDLICADDRGRVAGPDLILVESKTTGTSSADHALTRLGLRPVSISKYCAGGALLNPHLPANKWNRLPQQQFGWKRQPAAAAGLPGAA